MRKIKIQKMGSRKERSEHLIGRDKFIICQSRSPQLQKTERPKKRKSATNPQDGVGPVCARRVGGTSRGRRVGCHVVTCVASSLSFSLSISFHSYETLSLSLSSLLFSPLFSLSCCFRLSSDGAVGVSERSPPSPANRNARVLIAELAPPLLLRSHLLCPSSR